MKLLMTHMFLMASLHLQAGDGNWPRFRGPDGSGIAEGEKPPVEFGPGKHVLWQVAVPPPRQNRRTRC